MWWCSDCGEQELERRGKHHTFCHRCRKLRLYDDIAAAWFNAEAKRRQAGRPMPVWPRP